jgi:hypothetical protein
VLIHPDVLDRLELGTLIHDVFKYLDFKAPIKPQLSAYQLDSNIQSLILGFFETSFVKAHLDATIIKEYPLLLRLMKV